MTHRNRIIAAVLCGIGMTGSLPAQTSASVWDGVFSPDQVTRGRAIYADMCSECHQRALTGGGETRPLAGDRFLTNWYGETVGTLFDRIRVTMPFMKPGTLNRRQVADVVAFVLYFNNFPAGKAELSTRSEILNQIKITNARPQ